MNTKAYRTILASAGLAAACAIAGCDAREEPEPYAEEQTESATDSTYAAQDDTRATDPAYTAQDDTRTTGQDPATSMEGQSSMAGTSQLTEADVVGQTVVSQDGEEIGTVVQVVEGDTGMGQKMAIVEVGEFLGIGEKQVAIELDRLSLGADGQVRSDVTEDTLESMPEYDSSTPGESRDMAEQGTE
jgi:hypothetical protein